jgi:hypothetical protein
MSATVMGDHPKAVIQEEHHLVSQSSADSGQPCENTIGEPLPQSLKKIVTPSLVVIVSMRASPIGVSRRGLASVESVGGTEGQGGYQHHQRASQHGVSSGARRVCADVGSGGQHKNSLRHRQTLRKQIALDTRPGASHLYSQKTSNCPFVFNERRASIAPEDHSRIAGGGL